jgi:hypothetical protein
MENCFQHKYIHKTKKKKKKKNKSFRNINKKQLSNKVRRLQESHLSPSFLAVVVLALPSQGDTVTAVHKAGLPPPPPPGGSLGSGKAAQPGGRHLVLPPGYPSPRSGYHLAPRWFSRFLWRW